MSTITILINNQPHHVEDGTLTPDEFRNLADAPAEYEVWKIVKAPDPEGQLPLDDVQVTSAMEIESGDRFRVVPPGTFGGK